MAAESESKKETKYWCLTIYCENNERHKWRDHPCTLDPITTGKGATIHPTYICGQEEKCPTTGRWHRHIYIEFAKKVKFTTLKHKYPDIHIESRKSDTAEPARHYAQKDMDCQEFPVKDGELRNDDGQRFAFGTISDTKPGKRTDLELATQSILQGKRMRDVALEHATTFVKYHKGLQAFANIAKTNVNPFAQRTCRIYYSAVPGCGKSLQAKKDMYGSDFYEPQQNAQGQLSFETYDGEPWILLEEFNPKSLDVTILKRMMDRGRCVLPGRGSSVVGLHTGVIITTNSDPSKWYGKTDAEQMTEWKAVSRRCTEVWECTREILDGGDVTDPWKIIGGTSKPLGFLMDSPLLELQAWADQQAAAIAQPSNVISLVDVENADDSVEYSDISQASQMIDLSQDD